MTEHIDLKALERKAYTSYHQDGIVDIFLGLAIVIFGILLHPILIENMFYLMGGFFITWFISYAIVKKSITVPRIGYVEFKPSRRYRLVFLLSFLVILNLAIFAIMAFGFTPELRAFLNQYGLLVIAVVVGGLFVFFGCVTQIYRLCGYGAVAFLVFVITYFFVLYLSIPLIALGLVIAVTGFVLLFRFLRKYPKVKPGEESFEVWENE